MAKAENITARAARPARAAARPTAQQELAAQAQPEVLAPELDEQQDKLEQLQELFPDAVGDDGEFQFELLRQEVSKAEAERRQPRRDEADDAAHSRQVAKFNAGASVGRIGSITLLVASGVMLGLLLNSFFQPGMQYTIIHAVIFFLAVALLALNALFIFFVVFSIESYFRQFSAYAGADNGMREWRDTPPLALAITARAFMFLRIVPEADGTSAAHVRVRRSINYHRGRVPVHEFTRKVYRVPAVVFLVAAVGSIVFFVLQATTNGLG